MRLIRRAQERGHFDHGWLNAYHTFSFGNYYDPQQMGFRSLRVINEDRVQPGRGFGRHGHRDMEILTYVLEGVLEHQDSLGHVEQLRAGELQRMTAGSGIQHSEYNPSPNDTVHLYQIWIEPRQTGLTPEYEQRQFNPEARQGVFQLVASSDGRDGSMIIHQDTDIYLGRTNSDHPLRHSLDGHEAWLQVIRGTVDAGSQRLEVGDGMATNEQLDLQSVDDAEVMLFEFTGK